MKPLFHYTTKDRVESILAAGQILPATAGVMPPEIPAAWLSIAEKWEHTATKRILGANGRVALGTLSGMIAAGATLARIQIDPARVALIGARDIPEALNIPPAIHKALVRSAKQSGANPAEWRAVAGSIPVDAFLSIEFSDQCQPFQWVAFNPTAAKSAAA